MAQDYQIAGTLSLEDQMSNVLKNAMDSVSQFGSKTQNAMKNASASVEAVSKAMKLGGAAVTAMGVKSLKSFGDFQASLNKAAIIAGGTSKNIGELADVANKMGAELPLSAQDAADAMVAMAQDGASIDTIKQEFPAIAKAATAAGSDLQTTASVVQQSMNIWGKSLESPAQSAAILTETANMSNASIEDMQQALATIGGTATLAGISMQDTSTAIGLLTNRGYSAAQASQDLNHAILQIVAPSKVAKGAMDDLGISYTDAQGNMKPFPQILQEINSAMDGMKPDERAAALKRLFGTAGMGAIQPLLQSIQDETGNTTTSWDAFSSELQQKAGSNVAAIKTLDEQAADMQQNLGSKIEQIGGNWEAMRNSAMQSSSAVNGAILDMINKILELGGDSSTTFGSMAQSFIGFSTIIGPAILAVGQFTGSMNALFTGTSNLKTAFDALLSSQMLIMAGIAALVAILVLAYTKSEAFRQAISNIGQAFSGVFGPAIDGAKGAVNGIMGSIVSLATEIGNNLAGVLNSINWNAAFGTVKDVIDGLIKSVSNLIQALVNTGAVNAAWEFVKRTIGLLEQTFVDAQGDVANFIQSMNNSGTSASIFTTIGNAVKAIFDALTLVINGISQFVSIMYQTGAVSAIWQLISDTISTIVSIIGGAVQGVTAFITASSGMDFVSGIFTVIGTAIKLIADTLNFLMPLVAGVAAGFLAFNVGVKAIGLITTAVAGTTKAFEALKTVEMVLAVMNPFELIIVVVAAVVAAVVVAYNKFSWFRDFVNGIPQAIQDFWNGLVDWFTNLWNSIVAGATGIWNGFTAQIAPIVDAFKNLWNALTDFFTTLWGLIVQGAENAWSNFSTRFAPIVQAVEAVWNALPQFFSNVWSSIKQITSAVWDQIKNIVSTAINIVSTIISTTLNVIKSIWSAVWGVIKTVVTTVWNIIKTVVSTAINVVAGIIRAVTAIMKGDWSGAWKAIKGVAVTIWNGIKSVVTTAINGVKGVINSVLGGIKGIWDAGWKGVSNIIKTVWGFIKNTVKNNISAVKGLMNIGKALWNLGKAAIEGFWNGLKSMFNSVVKGVENFANNIGKTFKKILGIHSPSRVLRSIGSYTGQGFALGLNDEYKNVSNMSANLAEAAIPTIKPNSISDAVNMANKQISTGLNTNVNGEMTLTKQPAYIDLNLSGSTYQGFVDDITNAQNTKVDLQNKYRL